MNPAGTQGRPSDHYFLLCLRIFNFSLKLNPPTTSKRTQSSNNPASHSPHNSPRQPLHNNAPHLLHFPILYYLLTACTWLVFLCFVCVCFFSTFIFPGVCLYGVCVCVYACVCVNNRRSQAHASSLGAGLIGFSGSIRLARSTCEFAYDTRELAYDTAAIQAYRNPHVQTRSYAP